MKIIFFQCRYQGFGGRFHNITIPNKLTSSVLKLSAHQQLYPFFDVILGSSEQMFHFLKVVDYVNAKLSYLSFKAQQTLIQFANELYYTISQANDREFTPRNDWDPAIEQFVNRILFCSDSDLKILQLELQKTYLSRIDWAWSVIAEADKSPYGINKNYERMVRALELKMAGDNQFREDTKVCLEQGIFPVECSKYDFIWAIDANGKGQGLQCPAILEAGSNFFDKNIIINKEFKGKDFRDLFMRKLKYLFLNNLIPGTIELFIKMPGKILEF